MRRMKNILSFLLALVFLFGLIPTVAFAAPSTGKNHKLTYHDVDYQPDEKKVESDRLFANLPSLYDTSDNENATAPKDQGDYGTCWAFSATSSAEGSLGGQEDLSELQLAYYFYQPKIDPLGNASGDATKATNNTDGLLQVGGNNLFTLFALANWTNAAREGTLSYNSENCLNANNGTLGNDYAKDYVAHLQNARIIPYSASSTDINNVKQAIVKYSTLSCAYYHSSTYYNSSNAAYYTTKTGINHAVSIVGWDDNYSRSNFKWFCKPSQNGAWLVKNSWGTDWGQEGYFWLSYYDKSLIYSGAVFAFDFDSADTYDYNYQYDGSCGIQEMTVSDANQVAAIYEVKGLSSEAEKINAVGLGLASTNVSGTVSIYTGVDGNDPMSGTKVATQNFTTDYEGFYTVEIEDGPVVARGEQYSVVVDFNGDCGLFVDKSYQNGDWIEFTADTKNDRTYLVQNGTATNLNESSCTARIKAYTNATTPEVPLETYEVSFEANAEGVSNMPTAQTKIKDETLTLSSKKPTRDGYRFLGWAEDPAAEPAYLAGGSYEKNEAITLYAVWEETYTVTYNGNGEGVSDVPESQTKFKGEKLTLSSTIPTRDGYTFQGWKDSQGITYLAGDPYTNDSDVILYAVWEVKPEPEQTVTVEVTPKIKNGKINSFSIYAYNIEDGEKTRLYTGIYYSTKSSTGSWTLGTSVKNKSYSKFWIRVSGGVFSSEKYYFEYDVSSGQVTPYEP